MERKLCSLDLATLRELYERESEALHLALIGGASWDETRQQRIDVTEIAIELHKKINAAKGNPAENSIRSSPQ